MNRLRYRTRPLAGLIAAAALLGAAGTAAGQAERRPNVLLILVDDLRPELGAYGNARARSPHIDRLAREGVVFDRAYTQQAVCAPSRAVLLSGLRPDSTRIYDLQTPLRSVMPGVTSLPQLFREGGYTTVSIGKVYHHLRDDPQGWSVAPIDPAGGWKGRGYLAAGSIAQVEAYEAANPGRGLGRGPATEAAAVPDTAYPDGKIANRAIDQLRRLRDRPFFLAVGFHKPHLPFNAPQRYWDLYPAPTIGLPEHRSPPSNVTPYSLAGFGELRAYTDVPDQGPIPDELARTLIRGYLASLSYMDAQVGRVLAELRRLGLADNTIVVLWGDHGYKLGDHGSWNKHSNFEIDTRIPLIVRAPGSPAAGRRAGGFVETVDLYPTLAELAGLAAPAYLQGTSFAPLLRDPEQRWKSAAFSQYPRANGVMGYSIRVDRYHYVEWRRSATREVLARELYDHQHDPREGTNVAGEARYHAVVAELAGRLEAGWRAARPNHPGGAAGEQRTRAGVRPSRSPAAAALLP